MTALLAAGNTFMMLDEQDSMFRVRPRELSARTMACTPVTSLALAR